MKVVLVGGSGMIGRAVAASLANDGHDVVILSRDPANRSRIPPGVQLATWSVNDIPGLAAHLESADAIVNVAGARVGPRRWTSARKLVIRESRIGPTRSVVEAIRSIRRDLRPRVLVSASGTDGYTGRDDTDATETTPLGGGFLAEVCRAWEAEAERAEALGIRVVRLRIGPVLAREATVLRLMCLPIRLGLGGRLGSGAQWISWIHLDDLVGVVRLALVDDELRGVLNVVTPEPVRQVDMGRALARRLHRPFWLRVPAWLLRIALGEGAEVILGSRRVAPLRLLQAGYAFRWPTLNAALEEALG
jgi:uncharacterized protein (TIGR01777 family)